MKSLTRSTTVTVLLFLMAMLLLVLGSVGGARAALNLQSDIYESQIETTSINVSITESGEVVSNVMMLSSGDMVSRTGNPSDKEFKIGKVYDLPLSVTNNGSIDEYVRVTVYQYWVDPSGTVASTGWFDGSGTKDVRSGITRQAPLRSSVSRALLVVTQTHFMPAAFAACASMGVSPA